MSGKSIVYMQSWDVGRGLRKHWTEPKGVKDKFACVFISKDCRNLEEHSAELGIKLA